METISQRIFKIIDSSNKRLSDAGLAAAIGCSKPAVSRWRNDNREPAIKYLADIATYLGAPINYLIGIQKDFYEDLSISYLNEILQQCEGAAKDGAFSCAQITAIKNHLSDSLLRYVKLLKKFEDVSQDWNDKKLEDISPEFDMRAAFYREKLHDEINGLQDWIGLFPNFISRKEKEFRQDYSPELAQETANSLNDLIEKEAIETCINKDNNVAI
ncbi:MAG: helix-turn-helix domain-containing protein [Aminipila sp.]